jgi:hypothetical protein
MNAFPCWFYWLLSDSCHWGQYAETISVVFPPVIFAWQETVPNGEQLKE